MELLPPQPNPKRTPPKSREDWIVAALGALIDDGIEGVRVLKLAKTLGVTRGSFYWHFDSHDDLLDAVLAEWRTRNTGIILDVLQHSNTLETGILDLFAVWVDHSKFDPHLDEAVRDWGRRSDTIAESVATEDDNRITAIAAFFERQNYPKTEAFIRARVIYFTQLSYYALVGSEPDEKRMDYLETYFHCFTGRSITPHVAQEFLARVLHQRDPS